MEASYTETQNNFAQYWDKVVDEREPLTIHRRGAEDLVLLPADELSSLQETAHLLRSPKNAQRLLAALFASIEQEGAKVDLDSLKQEITSNEANS